MVELFRKSSVERFSSPEQLDKMLKITSPLSWVGILSAFVITVAVLIWAVLGSIPTTISVTGYFVLPYNTNTIFSTAPGTVSSIFVKTGETVKRDTVLLDMVSSTGEHFTIVSNHEGIISSALVESGTFLPSNTELFRITPKTEHPILLCYIEPSEAKRIALNDKAIAFIRAKSASVPERIEAHVINIDRSITTRSAIEEVLGTDYAQSIAEFGSFVAVTCVLDERIFDEEMIWNSTSNALDELLLGERTDVQFILDESAPIEKVFPALRGD